MGAVKTMEMAVRRGGGGGTVITSGGVVSSTPLEKNGTIVLMTADVRGDDDGGESAGDGDRVLRNAIGSPETAATIEPPLLPPLPEPPTALTSEIIDFETGQKTRPHLVKAFTIKSCLFEKHRYDDNNKIVQ